MKKTCNGCKAYEIREVKGCCELEYKIQDRIDLATKFLRGSKPLEECPKPETLIALKKIKKSLEKVKVLFV